MYIVGGFCCVEWQMQCFNFYWSGTTVHWQYVNTFYVWMDPGYRSSALFCTLVISLRHDTLMIFRVMFTLSHRVHWLVVTDCSLQLLISYNESALVKVDCNWSFWNSSSHSFKLKSPYRTRFLWNWMQVGVFTYCGILPAALLVCTSNPFLLVCTNSPLGLHLQPSWFTPEALLVCTSSPSLLVCPHSLFL